MDNDQHLALLAVVIASREGMEPDKAVDRAYEFIQAAQRKLGEERGSQVTSRTRLRLEPEPA